MQESVIYQDILQKGRQQEALSFCMQLLYQRFGKLDSLVLERVQELSIKQLENLGMSLLNILEVADLVAWLDQEKRDKTRSE